MSDVLEWIHTETPGNYCVDMEIVSPKTLDLGLFKFFSFYVLFVLYICYRLSDKCINFRNLFNFLPCKDKLPVKMAVLIICCSFELPVWVHVCRLVWSLFIQE